MINGAKNSTLIFCLLSSCAFLLLFTLYTYPFVTLISTHTIGAGDANIYYFNAYNFEYQLAQGNSVFKTDLLFQPHGSDMVMHTHTTTMSAFAWLTGNPVLGINLFIIINYVLSGLGAALISRKFIKNSVYCFLIGVLFAFSSYKMSRLEEHYNLILTGFIPFAIICYLNLRERLSVVLMTGFIICLILIGLSDYILLITTLIFIAVHFIWSLMEQNVRGLFRKYRWKAISVLILLILGLHFLTEGLRANGFNDNAGIWWSGDVSSFFIPYHNRIYQHWSLIDWHKEIIGGQYGLESTMFIGYGLIVLFLTAIIFKKSSVNNLNKPEVKKSNISTLIVPFTILVLLTIPQFKILDNRILYSPTSIFHFFPILNNHRCPTRIIHLVFLLLAIITFYLLENGKVARLFNNRWVICLITVLLVAEAIPIHYQFQDRSTNTELYQELKSRPHGNALILPLGIVDGYKPIGEFDIAQLGNIPFHQKPTFGGHLSRIDQETKDAQLSSPFINQIIKLETGQMVSTDCVVLNTNEVPVLDYIVIPSKYLATETHKYLLEQYSGQIAEKIRFDTGELWHISKVDQQSPEI